MQPNASQGGFNAFMLIGRCEKQRMLETCTDEVL